MKKFLIILITLFFVSNILLASDILQVVDLALSVGEGVVEAKESIENPEFPSYRNLKLRIDNLNINDDLDLFYQENKIPVLKPFLKNFFLGFGLGSKDQGRPKTAIAYSIIDTVIITPGILALVFFIPEQLLVSLSGDSMDSITIPIMLFSLAGLGLTHTIEAIDSLIYPAIYNSKLKKDLNLKASYNPFSKELSLGYKFVLS